MVVVGDKKAEGYYVTTKGPSFPYLEDHPRYRKTPMYKPWNGQKGNNPT